MAVVRPFHRYRGETSLTLKKMISILKELLPVIAPEQSRYLVTTVPTERTIRFYTTKGLVDNPLGREGQLALYGYRHLLQVLAVKYLQSHYLPLRKIQSIVGKASNRELEQLLPEIAPSSWTHLGFTREDRRVDPNPDATEATAAPASVPWTAAPAAPRQAGEPPDFAADPSAAAAADAWHRLEVGPGIELHVHAAALTAANRERLRGALLRELGVLRGWLPEVLPPGPAGPA